VCAVVVKREKRVKPSGDKRQGSYRHRTAVHYVTGIYTHTHTHTLVILPTNFNVIKFLALQFAAGINIKCV
jgi:hypothetical protein